MDGKKKGKENEIERKENVKKLQKLLVTVSEE